LADFLPDFPPDAPICLLAVIAGDEDFIDTHVGPFVQVKDAPSLPTVRDASGALLAFMRRFDAAALVVRPDRYVYRVLSAQQLQAAVLPGAP